MGAGNCPQHNMVFYDLNDTRFVLKRGNYNYHFSSQYNLRRFMEKEEQFNKEINNSLSNRFKFLVDAYDLSRFALYKKIERRGFLITKNGEPQEWLKI